MENEAHIAQIAYGKGRIPLHMDPALAEWQVITPKPEPALDQAHAAFLDACRNPIASPPLRSLVRPDERVVIVTSDGTRPVPNRLLIPWLLEELPVPEENVTVLLGTGTHRANTPEEIEAIFGAEVARRIPILNHDAYDVETNERLGTTASGIPIVCDRRYLEADKRIAVGFIEPHFFAGFSGGGKAVFPGVAGIETILPLHDYAMIAHPKSTWAVLEGNPIQEAVREMVGHCPPDFLLNVTLNREKAITGFYAGDIREAHQQGCARVKETSMAPVSHRFPIVVTSNSGFPLDQNLYQTVKGMSAAERIVEDGGSIVTVSECGDGIPEHGNFRTILGEGDTPEAILQWIRDLEAPVLDQWEAHILANVRLRAQVLLHSTLAPDDVEAALLTPVQDVQAAVEDCIRAAGRGVAVAVLPEGPQSVPYLG